MCCDWAWRALLTLAVACSPLLAPAQEADPNEDAAPSADSPEQETAAKNLRFNFQRQPWDAVLQWLAEQADLSLVLDSPPPGSFNYSDTRSYSAEEAIDLVNGILAAKGYTLLRRERMLMLVDLRGDLPRSLIPRVKPEELPTRGRYEFVTVAFPVGNRPADQILLEIQPLLSQYGEASALASSRQLIVTDRAGLMQIVGTVIESIPAPSSGSPAAPKPPRELRVYDLDGADGNAAVELLSKIASGNFVVDPAGDRLNVYATADQHKVIETLMNQIRGASGENRFSMEVYPIPGLSPAQQTSLVDDLAEVAGAGRVRFDGAGEQLVVWASQQSHQVVRKALFTLLAAGGHGGARTARVYGLRYADSENLLPLLQAAVPDAKLHQGDSQRLIAIANSRDHQILAELTAQLDRPVETSPLTWREYRLQQNPPAELSELIAEAAPKAKVRIDAARRVVVITGSERDQQIVASMIADLQLDQALSDDRLAWQVYQLEQEPPPELNDFIREAAPRAKVRIDTQQRTVTVTGVRRDQQTVARLIADLALDQPKRVERLVWKEYRLGAPPPEELSQLLADAAPRAKVRVDAPRRAVIVTGREQDQQVIAEILAGFQEDLIGRPQRPLKIYALSKVQQERFEKVQNAAQELAPDAEIDWNATSGELFVWAAADQQESIAQLLESLDAPSRRDATRALKAYSVAAGELDALNTLAGSVAPDAVTTIDRPGRRLLVWAEQDDHEKLAPILEAGTAGGGPRGPALLRSYTAAEIDLTLAVRVLSERFPGAQFDPDTVGKAIVARATAGEHEQISELVDQFRAGSYLQTIENVRVYPLGSVTIEQAGPLAQLFPRMQISVDPATRSLAARGDDQSHRQLEEALESLGGNRSSGGWQIRVFPLEHAQASEVATGIGQLMPGVTAAAINDAQLLIRYQAHLDQQVSQLITQLDSRRDSIQRQEAQVFPVKRADPNNLVAALTALFPAPTGAAFSYDDQTKSIMAVADRQQMELIREVVSAADRENDSQEVRVLKVHALAGVDGNAALAALEQLFNEQGANPLLTLDGARRRLVVVATADQQDAVRDVLETLAPERTELEVFPLETMEPFSAQLAIGRLFDGLSTSDGTSVSVEADDDGARILVRATPEQLQDIRELLVKMGEVHLLDAGAGNGVRYVPWQIEDRGAMLRRFRAAWEAARNNPLVIDGEPESSSFEPAASPAEQPPVDRTRVDQRPVDHAPVDGPLGQQQDGEKEAPEATALTDAAAEADATSIPVHLSVGVDGVTVSSGDPAALGHAVSLLRNLGGRAQAARYDFGVYPLRNADAERVSNVLQQMYTRARIQNLTFAADVRMNAVIVKGGRAERREVEALLQSLDSQQEAEFFKPDQPEIIGLENVSAENVLAQLKTLYAEELARGQRQPPIEIPPGASPEVVATLQQINASRGRPLLSLEVDANTNRLLVIAPRPLLREIRDFVAQIDQRSDAARVGVRIIQLKNLQGAQVLKSLEGILRE